MLNGAAGTLPEVKINLLEDNGLKKVFEALIDRDGLLINVENAISLEAESVHIAGFRPGKAPRALRLNAVRKKKGEEIFGKEIRYVVGMTIDKIVADENLLLSSQPSVDFMNLKDDKWFACNISMNVLPQIPKVDLSDNRFKFVSLELKISESDIEEARSRALSVLQSHVSAEEGYKSSVGDAVLIDFVGTVNGEEFEGNQLDDAKIVIGEGQFIKEFEDQLVSLRKGDKKDIKVPFPEDYDNNEIAGKVVSFSITVKDVMKVRHTSINEESIKEFGVNSMKEFEQMLSDRVHRDFTVLSRLYAKKTLFDLFDKHVDFEVPESIVKADLESVKNENRIRNIQNKNRGLPEENITPEEEYKVAKKRSKLGLILTSIARANDIKVTKEDVDNAKNIEIQRNGGADKERIEELYNNEEALNRIMGAILEEKIVDFLFSKITVEKKTVTSKEFNENYLSQITGK